MEQNFEKLFADELADIYDAEQQILKALPKMIQAVSSDELREALEEHRVQTEGQVERLEQIFSEIGEQPKKKCKGMAGLLAEGEEMIKEDLEPEVKDAALIGAAQKVEHYEIAAYGTARTFAAYLGNERAIELLEETLEEEKEADQLLTQIAEASVNSEAAASGEDEEGELGEGNESGGARRARSRQGATSGTRASAKSKKSGGKKSSK
jgi:ferritin-like metal-binding protein YciE